MVFTSDLKTIQNYEKPHISTNHSHFFKYFFKNAHRSRKSLTPLNTHAVG